MESLTSNPKLENSLGQKRNYSARQILVRFPPLTDTKIGKSDFAPLMSASLSNLRRIYLVGIGSVQRDNADLPGSKVC